MRIWIIDDHREIAALTKEKIGDGVPLARVEVFHSIRNALEKTRGPDIALIDISTICEGVGDHFFSALAKFSHRFPGATIIICSAVANIIDKEFREDIEENGIENSLHFVQKGKEFFSDLIITLREVCGVKKQ